MFCSGTHCRRENKKKKKNHSFILHFSLNAPGAF